MSEKLILVCYLNIDYMNDCDIVQYAKSVEKQLKHEELYKLIIIPQPETETRIECINPKLITENEYKKVLEVIENLNSKILITTNNGK